MVYISLSQYNSQCIYFFSYTLSTMCASNFVLWLSILSHSTTSLALKTSTKQQQKKTNKLMIDLTRAGGGLGSFWWRQHNGRVKMCEGSTVTGTASVWECDNTRLIKGTKVSAQTPEREKKEKKRTGEVGSGSKYAVAEEALCCVALWETLDHKKMWSS